MSSAHAANLLAKEKSPYLLQHAHNPVNWYPWCDEAFERAAREDKPVLLSIGYSTCHWCHVMAHESFENPQTAALLNEHFISIKVDREERPDIDHLYMEYVVATTGSGGWPMTVFLTPAQKPFFGGTYFPPENRYGMPGFRTLLTHLSESWKTRKPEIIQSAESAVAYLRSRNEAESATSEAAPLGESIRACADAFKQRYDSRYGGFGRAPKFPMAHSLSFLLRYAALKGDSEAKEAALFTLEAMALGGIYDHVGGGFHRYSTDAHWRIPHFEKMLYDQAGLAAVYTEAYQMTQDPFFKDTACGILDYVLRDLTSPEGGFYSAEDADSALPGGGPKKEGAYYVWKKNEILEILGREQGEIFCERYGVTDSGNAITDPHHEFEGLNVLYLRTRSQGDTLAQSTMSLWGAVRSARLKRPRPHLDDKILTDWNGMMISALAAAGRALDRPAYLEAAQKAGEFIWKTLRTSGGDLCHRVREAQAGISGHLGDYAFLAEAYLDLYETTLEERWVERSLQLAEELVKKFWDPKRKRFYMTGSDEPALIARPVDGSDGASPSGNSTAVTVLSKLSKRRGGERWAAYVRDVLNCFSAEIRTQPTAFSKMLSAALIEDAGGPEWTISGRPGDPELSLIIREIYSKFMPGKTIHFKENSENSASLCLNHVCERPIQDLDTLKKRLASFT